MNPANIQELEQIAVEEWEKLSADKCRKLTHSCKICLAAVIVTKGSATKY